MSKIIGEEIELVREIEHIKNALLKEPEYHPYAIFREIDQDGDNRISKEEIGNFLRKTGFHANEQETLAIIRRIDTEGDYHVNFGELE